MSEVDLAPRCPRCKARHVPFTPEGAPLRCWSGRYALRISRHILTIKGPNCSIRWDTDCTGFATTADHDVPRSRGGLDDDDNLVPACLHCNSARGNAMTYPPEPSLPGSGAGYSPRWRQ